MAVVYSNPLNLFNLTVKGTPIGADLLPLGDSAVTGTPLKQCTVSSLPFSAGSGALTKIATATASASASVNFDNDLSATYDNYLVVFENILPVTTSVGFVAQFGTTATPTYQTSGYDGLTWQALSSGSTVAVNAGNTTNMYVIDTTQFQDNTASRVIGGTLFIQNANGSTDKTMTSQCAAFGSAKSMMHASGNRWESATVITSIKFLMSSGNVSTGTIKLYGIQN